MQATVIGGKTALRRKNGSFEFFFWVCKKEKKKMKNLICQKKSSFE